MEKPMFVMRLVPEIGLVGAERVRQGERVDAQLAVQ